jgi:transcriptional regulator with XRE-family HTH domain
MTNTNPTHTFAELPWSPGDVLAKLRHISGVSSQEMADILGVSRNTIGNYEHDRTSPNKATILIWAQTTGADWLPEWWDSYFVGYTENSDHEAILAGV